MLSFVMLSDRILSYPTSSHLVWSCFCLLSCRFLFVFVRSGLFFVFFVLSCFVCFCSVWFCQNMCRPLDAMFPKRTDYETPLPHKNDMKTLLDCIKKVSFRFSGGEGGAFFLLCVCGVCVCAHRVRVCAGPSCFAFVRWCLVLVFFFLKFPPSLSCVYVYPYRLFSL